MGQPWMMLGHSSLWPGMATALSMAVVMVCHLFAVESSLASAMTFSQEELSAPKPPTWLTGSLACPAFSGSHL